MNYLESLHSLVDRKPEMVPAESDVDPTLIRLWLEAIGDQHPAYAHDVAPPAMLIVWDMPGMRLAHGDPYRDVRAEVLHIMQSAGFGNSIVVETGRRYIRYLTPGETLLRSTVVETASDLQHTRLGPGHYVTWRTDLFDADQQLVGWLRLRILHHSAVPHGADKGGQPTTESR